MSDYHAYAVLVIDTKTGEIQGVAISSEQSLSAAPCWTFALLTARGDTQEEAAETAWRSLDAYPWLLRLCSDVDEEHRSRSRPRPVRARRWHPFTREEIALIRSALYGERHGREQTRSKVRHIQRSSRKPLPRGLAGAIHDEIAILTRMLEETS